MENACFGSLDSQFLGKSREYLFWKLGFSFFGQVSWKTFVLELALVYVRSLRRWAVARALA